MIMVPICFLMNCLCVTAMMSWWYDDDVIMMSCLLICMWYSEDVISSFALVYFSYTLKEDARYGRADGQFCFHEFPWLSLGGFQSIAKQVM